LADKEFEKVVEVILTKYAETPLRKRWEEAISFGTGAGALAHWIRDSEDVVNIVWLSPTSIRDVTWVPTLNQAIFNFLPLRNITSIEVREGADIGKLFKYGVKGNLMVRMLCIRDTGDLAWIADGELQARELKVFLSKVLEAHSKAIRL